MGVEVDKHTVLRGKLGEDGVEPTVIGPGDARIDPEEVLPVIPKRRIVDVAHQHRANR